MKFYKKLDLNLGITILLSLVIIIDFMIPGKEFSNQVLEVKSKKQRYYNAAKNYHFTYKVITSEHEFPVSENFAKTAQGSVIKYSVSRIFKEINTYKLVSESKSNIHSFRYTSGLIFPLVMIFAIILAVLYNKTNNRFLYVLQIILLFDLIVLLR